MNNNIVLIGASGGVGKEIFDVIVKSSTGINLVVLTRSRFAAIDQETNVGLTITNIICNLNCDESVHEAACQLSRLKRIDCLINAAGIGYHAPVEEITSDEISETFSVNTLGPIKLITAILPLLDASKSPLLINVSSVLARKSIPFTGAYTASKHALEGYLKVLRQERPRYKITNIEPGAIETRFIEKTNNKRAASHFGSRMLKKIDPKDIAKLVEMVISLESEVETIIITPTHQNII